MSSTEQLQARAYKPGEKVRLVNDIPGYATGSKGKIALANGLTWKRYWVRFPDGTSTSHVDHGSLVRLKDYDTFLVLREREAVAAKEAAEAAANAPAVVVASTDTAADGAEINGVAIPQLLLDRSAAARTRLGG